MKKVLIIGGSSFIGLQFLEKYNTKYQLWATYYKNSIMVPNITTLQLDICDLEKVKSLIRSINPEVVVLCSAISSLTEDTKQQFEAINVQGVDNIVQACKDINARLLFLSSDCVFSGENGPYGEADKTAPIQLYGKSKRDGENLVQKLSSFAIIRTSLVYGWPQQFQHGNFVTILIEKMKKRENFVAHVDMCRTPSYVGDVNEALRTLIDNPQNGIFHVGSPDYINMYDFANIACEVFNLPKETLQKENAPAEYKIRPRQAGLICHTSEEQLNIKFKTVKEGLQAMKEEMTTQNVLSGSSQKKGLALVTGGAGFIGSHLVEALVEKGYQVRVIDSLVKGKFSSIKSLVDQGKVEFIEGDIRNKDSVDLAMKNVEYVFHTAGIHIEKSVKSPDDCIANNIQGSYNVFKSALDHNVKRVIFSSSSSAYGDPQKLPMAETDHPLPVEPYGASKLFCEHLLQHLAKKGLKYNALRYFNVYGERQAAHAYYTTVVIHFIKRIMNNEPPTIDGKGDQSMDFTHVSDVVQANILAMEAAAVNQVFNVGTGVSTSVKQLAEIIINALGKKLEPIFREREVYVTKRQADITKVKELLGFIAKVKVEDGIAEVAQQIAAHPERY